MSVSLQIAHNYISYKEKETGDVVKTRVTDTLSMDSLGDLDRNIKGVVELSPVKAIFMDSWYTLNPKFSESEFEFMNVDKFEQTKVTNSDPNEADFGFTFVMMRSETREYHKREVYSILDYLGDIGGFAGILEIFIEFILGIFLPAAKTRTILNDNFKYDSGNYKKRQGHNDPFDTSAHHDERQHSAYTNLRDRLKSKNDAVKIGPQDLTVL